MNKHEINFYFSEITGAKRENYLDWPDYFMAIAFLSAQRSKDPRTQVRYIDMTGIY